MLYVTIYKTRIIVPVSINYVVDVYNKYNWNY